MRLRTALNDVLTGIVALALVLAVGSTFPAAALAQAGSQTQQQQQQQQPDPQELQREEQVIVVGYSALYGAPESYSVIRLAAPLLQIPQSAAIVTEQVISDQQALNLDQAVRNVAGVTPVASGTNAANLYSVRGFVTPNYRDGFRVGFSEFGRRQGPSPRIEPFGVERIEVLKGPSALMYGRGEPGGIVNFVAKRPLFTRQILFDFIPGSNGLFKGQFDATGPLGSTNSFAYRVVGVADRADSYRNDVQSSNYYVRPMLTWNVNGRTTLDFSFEALRDESTPDEGVFLLPLNDVATPSPYSTRENFYGEPGFNSYETKQVRGQIEFRSDITDYYELRAQWFVEDMSQDNQQAFLQYYNWNGVLGIFGFPPSSINHLARGNLFADSQRTDTGLRVENVFRASHEMGGIDVDHQVLASVDYLHVSFLNIADAVPRDFFSVDDGSSFHHPSLDNPIFANVSNNDRTTEDLAFVVQDYIGFADRVFIIAGARVENATSRSITTNTSPILPSSDLIELDDTEVLPRLGGLVMASEDVSLWASYSASYTPSFGQLTIDNEPVKPEKGDQFEFGVKSRLADSLSLTASYFHILKNDVIIANPDNPLFAINGGEERSRGFEIEAVGQVTPQFKIVSGYAYIDQEFTSHPDLQGNRRFGVPEHSGSVWAVYDVTTGTLQGFSFGGGVFYTGETWSDNTNATLLPAYTTVDLMGAYVWDRWRFQLNLKNITDEDYFIGQGYGNAANPTTPIMVMTGAPREVVFSVGARF